jgi:hypothetical protein
MSPILDARKQASSGTAQLGIAERRGPDLGCAVFPITLPENLRVYVSSDGAGRIEREVSKLARSRQADHGENTPRPHERGHTRETGLCVHVMERRHRNDQVEACGLERILEEITKDILESCAALSTRELDGAHVEIDAHDTLRYGGQLSCEHPFAAADVERERTVGGCRRNDQRVVMEIVVPAVRLYLVRAIRLLLPPRSMWPLLSSSSN